MRTRTTRLSLMAGLAACLALSPVGTGLAMAAQDNVMTAEPPAEEGFEEAEFAADDDAGLTAGWRGGRGRIAQR
ncbi:hypothetical protein [Hyphomonas sp.]|uniref:hypothetical protein n=1 Tax=Hyphomonas sp. TaxID=87 RepID=UPI001BCB785C|nr:hypothetical protein [Hyphomonas sp.]